MHHTHVHVDVSGAMQDQVEIAIASAENVRGAEPRQKDEPKSCWKLQIKPTWLGPSRMLPIEMPFHAGETQWLLSCLTSDSGSLLRKQDLKSSKKAVNSCDKKTPSTLQQFRMHPVALEADKLR